MLGIKTRRLISCESYKRRFSRDFKDIWRGSNKSKGRIIEKILRDESEIVDVISRNTEITSDHMTPEMRFFLLTPNCPLYHANLANDITAKERRVFSDPFWSIYWPGGQALSRFILDENTRLFPVSRKNQINVLDLGAGCGASGIAAKLSGAKKVVANDIDKVACVAVSMNAVLNNVDIQVSQENLLNRKNIEQPYEVIFIGDMLYEEEIAETLIPWLERYCKRGSRIYLGDPGRHGLTNDFQKRLRLLRRYPLPESVRKENYGFDEASVWEFLCSK